MFLSVLDHQKSFPPDEKPFLLPVIYFFYFILYVRSFVFNDIDSEMGLDTNQRFDKQCAQNAKSLVTQKNGNSKRQYKHSGRLAFFFALNRGLLDKRVWAQTMIPNEYQRATFSGKGSLLPKLMEINCDSFLRPDR